MSKDEVNQDKDFVGFNIGALQNLELARYLQSKGIPFEFARKYLSEVSVHYAEQKKNFIALAMRNIKDGYELKNECHSACILPRSISFIHGSGSVTKEIHVFENVIDFLSVLTARRRGWLEGDAIILHSASCLYDAVPYLMHDNYKTLYSLMSNTHEGVKSVLEMDEFIIRRQGFTHKAMNFSYAPFEHVNAWHVFNQKQSMNRYK